MPFHFINPNMPNDWDSLVRTLSDPRKKLREKWSHGKIIDYSIDTNNNLNDALDIPLPSQELGSFTCLKNEIAETKLQMPCTPRLNTSDIEPDLLLQPCGDLDETAGRKLEINENHVRNAFSNGTNRANKEGSSSGGITSDVRFDTSNANSNAHLQQRIEGKVKSVLKPYYLENKIDKAEYKEVLRKCVPKICQSRSKDYNQSKIERFVLEYINKVIYCRKIKKKNTSKRSTYTPAHD